MRFSKIEFHLSLHMPALMHVDDEKYFSWHLIAKCSREEKRVDFLLFLETLNVTIFAQSHSIKENVFPTCPNVSKIFMLSFYAENVSRLFSWRVLLDCKEIFRCWAQNVKVIKCFVFYSDLSSILKKMTSNFMSLLYFKFD